MLQCVTRKTIEGKKKQEKKKEKKENNRVKRANENKDKIESNSMTDAWRRIRE